MAQHSHSSAPQKVPAEMLATHRAGWHRFTRGIVYVCVATAAVLLLMLVFFKVL